MYENCIAQSWAYTATTLDVLAHDRTRSHVLVAIIKDGGKADWIEDHAILTGQAPMAAFDDLDRIHSFGGDPDDIRSYMSSPYGWATALKLSINMTPGAAVRVDVYGKTASRRHAVHIATTDVDGNSTHTYLAHLPAHANVPDSWSALLSQVLDA